MVVPAVMVSTSNISFRKPARLLSIVQRRSGFSSRRATRYVEWNGKNTRRDVWKSTLFYKSGRIKEIASYTTF